MNNDIIQWSLNEREQTCFGTVEASSLGWKPGVFPQAFTRTSGRGANVTFSRVSSGTMDGRPTCCDAECDWVEYTAGSFTVRVYND